MFSSSVDARIKSVLAKKLHNFRSWGAVYPPTPLGSYAYDVKGQQVVFC